MEGEAPKRGRPAKPPGERKGGNLTFRLHPRLRALLEDAARQSGRTMTQEVERRVEASFAAEKPSLTAEDVRQIVREEMGRGVGSGSFGSDWVVPAHMLSNGRSVSGAHPCTISPPRCFCGQDGTHGSCGAHNCPFRL